MIITDAVLLKPNLKPPIIDRHVFWGFYDTTSSIYICRPFRYAYMWYECQQSSSRSLWSLWKYIFLSSFICTLFVQSLLLKSVFESCICSRFYWLYNQSHHLWKFLKSVFKTCVSCFNLVCNRAASKSWAMGGAHPPAQRTAAQAQVVSFHFHVPAVATATSWLGYVCDGIGGKSWIIKKCALYDNICLSHTVTDRYHTWDWGLPK